VLTHMRLDLSVRPIGMTEGGSVLATHLALHLGPPLS
jgi:hypothetical protein